MIQTAIAPSEFSFWCSINILSSLEYSTLFMKDTAYVLLLIYCYIVINLTNVDWPRAMGLPLCWWGSIHGPQLLWKFDIHVVPVCSSGQIFLKRHHFLSVCLCLIEHLLQVVLLPEDLNWITHDELVCMLIFNNLLNIIIFVL